MVFILLVHLCLSGGALHAQSEKQERHILVSMRMIGHQVLLNAGDTTSRVFPVEKKGTGYQISFDSAFGFNPGELAATVDRLILQTKIASSYIVEVKTCETEAVVYSYEKGDSVNPDLIPCGPRFQPEACYVLFITILKPYAPLAVFHNPAQISLKETAANPFTAGSYHASRAQASETKRFPGKKQMSYAMIALPIGSVFLFLGAFVYFRKKKPVTVTLPDEPFADPDIFQVGSYRFDQKNMLLIHGEESTELSGKESDLLFLLYANANKTLEREYLLKMIWADEGDYIGRTLDVFISKLRKKLESDPGIRIVNIRGIGYKFILN